MGKSPTFDQINNNSNTLTRGKYLKFCLDFNFPLSQEAFLHIYNKSCNYSKEMTYPQFKFSLEQLKGGVSKSEFIKFLGLQSSKTCLSKCKPFSKKNGASLPDLPALVPIRKKVLRIGTEKKLPKESRDPSINTERSKRLNSSLVFNEERNRSARRLSLYSRGMKDSSDISPNVRIVSFFRKQDLVEMFN